MSSGNNVNILTYTLLSEKSGFKLLYTGGVG